MDKRTKKQLKLQNLHQNYYSQTSTIFPLYLSVLTSLSALTLIQKGSYICLSFDNNHFFGPQNMTPLHLVQQLKLESHHRGVNIS